jgi:hypothetical protein
LTLSAQPISKRPHPVEERQPGGRRYRLRLGRRHEATEFDQIVPARRATSEMFFDANAGHRGEGALKIRAHRLRIEPRAERRKATAPRQVLPEHRLEILRRVVSFKSHLCKAIH